MNIQIFGFKKCFETKKAERYFKERKIKYQFVDLKEKGLSKGELSSVIASVGINELIDPKSKEYKLLNVEHIRGNSMKEELLLKNPNLYKTPIVRNGKYATVGVQIDSWKQWEKL